MATRVVTGLFRNRADAWIAAEDLKTHGFTPEMAPEKRIARPAALPVERGAIVGALALGIMGAAFGRYVHGGGLPGLMHGWPTRSSVTTLAWALLLGSLGGMAGFAVAIDQASKAEWTLVAVVAEDSGVHRAEQILRQHCPEMIRRGGR